jgi:arylsulfatase A-like enzyme/Flp pilus assembly protein TadD
VRGLVLACVLCLAACAREPSPKPSILLVTIDTLRADHVGCYGNSGARTPALDSLAAGGVRFEEARSHAPLTAPSHATLLTGVLPPRHGVRGNGPFRLRHDAPSLAGALRQAGYRTAAVVASVVLDRSTGLDQGFDAYDDNQRTGPKAAFRYLERGASQVEAASLQALQTLNPPFFLWVHFYDPHVPWVAPEIPGYDGEIAFADAALGRVIEAARARAGTGIVVLATSDHGESLGEHGENQHGYTLHRGVLRVPLLLAGPEIPRGRTVPATVGLVDVAPTLADLAGVELRGAAGRSLRRFWEGRAPRAVEEEPLWQETLHPLFDSGWAPLRGLLDARWSFVDAPSPELYDRQEDVHEREDVAASHGDVVQALSARLRALRTALGDTDPEPAPEDAERRERLASLGYLSLTAAESGPRLDPKDGLRAFLAVEEAEVLLERGNAARARDLVAPFLPQDPTNPRLWHTLAKARARLGDLDAAEEGIRRAIELAGGLEFLRYTQAEILRLRGDERGVATVLEAIVKDNPRAVEASLELSAMAMRRGDGETAKAVLQRSLDAGARDPDLFNRMARTLLGEGREADAVSLFAQSLVLWPQDPVALLEMGQAALRASDPARAIDTLQRCAAFECRIELARAYVVGPRDLEAARRELLAARALVSEPRLRAEVDTRLLALDSMMR